MMNINVVHHLIGRVSRPRAVPCGLLAMSVHIVNEEPVHVIPGSALLLNARMEHGPLEDIAMVTWEREPKTGASPQRVTLATCPGRRAKCFGSRSNILGSVEQQDTSLQIIGYRAEDSGVYTVTVTDHRGATTSAQCIVRTYGTVMELLRYVLHIQYAGMLKCHLIPAVTIEMT